MPGDIQALVSFFKKFLASLDCHCGRSELKCNHNSQHTVLGGVPTWLDCNHFLVHAAGNPCSFPIRNCPCITIRTTPHRAWITRGKLARCPNNWPKAAVVWVTTRSRPRAAFSQATNDGSSAGVRPSSPVFREHWSPECCHGVSSTLKQLFVGL